MELITLEIDPVPYTRTIRGKSSKYARRYGSYQKSLRQLAGNFQLPPAYSITFVIPFPKSYSKRRRERLIGQPHTQRPDLDNLVKAVQDSLCTEDGYIHSTLANKQWGPEGRILICCPGLRPDPGPS